MDDREKLACLDDLVLEAIMGRSEAEALGSVTPDDLTRLDAAFSAARATQAGNRMKRAKQAVAASRALAPRPSHTRIPPASPSRPATLRPMPLMTLAARSARADHDADQAGIDEDLAELQTEEGDGQ